LLVVVVVACGVADRRQPPGQQVGVRCELAGITWYQRTLAVRLPLFGVSCRLARCGPWTPHGTMAPPPRNAAA
jgi:putative component of membrane protein insertase Oxa1/YidC/SpoIIIJ protein YidD